MKIVVYPFCWKGRSSIFFLYLAVVLTLFPLSVFVLQGSALAATLTVTSTADDGAGSLRQALVDAASGDTILFDTTSFPDATTGTIDLTSGALIIDKPLTINGEGRVTLDAGANSRIVSVDDGDPDILSTVTLSGLVLLHGNAASDDGGALLNRENLTLTDSLLSANHADGKGGAIATLSPLDCFGLTLTNNTSGSYGGAVFVDDSGSVTCTESRFSENSAGHGGGIYIYGGDVSLDRVTLDLNSATSGNGGAIHSAAYSTLSVRNSTLSRNTATGSSGYGYGGGIYLHSSATISNSTISSNTAKAGSAMYLYYGTGTVHNTTIAANAGANYAVELNDSKCYLVSTIIADSENHDLARSDTDSTLTAEQCLIEDGSTLPASIYDGDDNDNIVGHDARLGPLRNYGGDMETHVLHGDSPAIDTGSDPDALTTDQRGDGYDRVVGGGIDMGSVEDTYDMAFSTLTVTSRADDGTGSLRQTLADALPGDSIVFDTDTFADADSGTITLTSGSLIIDKEVHIDGDRRVTINAEGNSRIFTIGDDLGSRLDISLQGLVMKDGHDDDRGGSVYTVENLTLTDCDLLDSSAGSSGGALFAENQAEVLITGGHISNNSADHGGGIYISGANVNLDRVTLDSNSATSGHGGAIHSAAYSSLSVHNSTITHNVSTGGSYEGYGGAVYLHSSAAISNSTIYANSGKRGSAIYLYYATGTIHNTTIAANAGADYAVDVEESKCYLMSSIIADSENHDLARRDTDSTLAAEQCLIEDGSTLPDTIYDGDDNGNIVGHAADLFSLADYGGPTQTCALKDTSPAISAGSNPDGLVTDQRGTGYARVLDGGIDIGAVEHMANTMLTVTLTGSGDGVVTGSDNTISCGTDCSEGWDPNIASGISVTLTATPATGSGFTGWSGDCNGTADCVVTMGEDRNVTAQFTLLSYPLTVTRDGNGSGVVSSTPAGIACGDDCTETYDYNSTVTLTASPGTGSTFSGWSGSCSGTESCTVTMDQLQAVTATFTLNTYNLAVTASDHGTIISSPSGIVCGDDCTEVYNYGTAVSLVATPDTGYMLSAWSGDCSGSGSCSVTMDQDRSVAATFVPAAYTLTVSSDGTGSGMVSSDIAGINCGSDCSAIYAAMANISLHATPGTGSVFSGWTGDCSGTEDCSLLMDRDHAVVALFSLVDFPLTVSTEGSGNGQVTSDPAGITCGTDCTEYFDYGQVVILTAVPAEESTFLGWSGACAGKDDCAVTIDETKNVTAYFGSSFSWDLFLPAIIGPHH